MKTPKKESQTFRGGGGGWGIKKMCKVLGKRFGRRTPKRMGPKKLGRERGGGTQRRRSHGKLETPGVGSKHRLKKTMQRGVKGVHAKNCGVGERKKGKKTE